MIFPAGLINLSNSCYINSVLQLLLNIPEFCTKLLEIQTSEPFIITLQNLFKYCICISESGIIIKPKSFIKTLFETTTLFKMGEQGDSHEFLLFILDIIDVRSNSTIVRDLFYGKLSKTYQCMCGFVSESEEDFNFLGIAASSGDICTGFTQLLCTKQDITSKCEMCHLVVTKQATSIVKKQPKYLIFQIQRFGNNGQKIQTPVKINGQVYNRQFKGCISHFGNTYNGHYNYTGVYDNETIYAIDDAFVTTIKDICSVSTDSYIVLYGKMNNVPSVH
jgi:ubiquitin C-terminal hydrolase